MFDHKSSKDASLYNFKLSGSNWVGHVVTSTTYKPIAPYHPNMLYFVYSWRPTFNGYKIWKDSNNIW
jgi:hypothetical protein